MTAIFPEKLVVFDYSGTLSPEASRFARSENLIRAFRESGLARFGVATPELFWQEIVNPTWTRGSKTAVGYKRAIAERVATLGLAPAASEADIAAAASRFVDLYLAHSRIDPRWRPVLTELACDPAAAAVIATDHYAEATEAIAGHLASVGIGSQRADHWLGSPACPGERAAAAAPSGGPDEVTGGRSAPADKDYGRPAPLLIANSADIGFWKKESRFWDALRMNPLLEKVRSLLVVDDFGFNEEKGDAYAERSGVEARRRETLTAVEECFRAPPEVILFVLEGAERNPGGDGGRQIGRTIPLIRAFLRRKGKLGS